MTLDQLNESERETARKALLECCGSRAWADQVADRRPIQDLPALHSLAEEVWLSITPTDWREAFAAHPKIGETKSSAKWSASEQSGMSQATDETAAAISRLNEEYSRKFGWIFIVCATGKSAAEMRLILETRIQNDSESELALAAAEQLKITQLRLAKLVSE